MPASGIRLDREADQRHEQPHVVIAAKAQPDPVAALGEPHLLALGQDITQPLNDRQGQAEFRLIGPVQVNDLAGADRHAHSSTAVSPAHLESGPLVQLP